MLHVVAPVYSYIDESTTAGGPPGPGPYVSAQPSVLVVHESAVVGAPMLAVNAESPTLVTCFNCHQVVTTNTGTATTRLPFHVNCQSGSARHIYD